MENVGRGRGTAVGGGPSWWRSSACRWNTGPSKIEKRSRSVSTVHTSSKRGEREGVVLGQGRDPALGAQLAVDGVRVGHHRDGEGIEAGDGRHERRP